MEIRISWKNLPALQAGYKLLCIDKIEGGFLKLIQTPTGHYTVNHEVPGENWESWTTAEGSFIEALDIYTETLFEELA